MSVVPGKESYAISRAGGLGGTDMAAIVGLSPWKRPIDIWQAKVNPQSVPEITAEHLRWGLLLEPVIRGEYAAKFGIDIIPPGLIAEHFPKYKMWSGNTLVVGKEEWMLAAPDGWMNSIRNGWECKTSSRRTDEWGPEGSDEVPAPYMVQTSWYTEVCEAKGWNFGVLFSGNSLEQFRIPRDEQFGHDLIEAGRTFWYDNVLKQVEPPIDESESYGKYLARKFSLNTGAVIANPSPEILEWTAKMKLADDAEKSASEEKRYANNQLRALIGYSQKAMSPLGSVGWVKGRDSDLTDWKLIANELSALYDDARAADAIPAAKVIAKSTVTGKMDPYLRAWWKR